MFKIARALAPSVVMVEEVQRVWGKAPKGAADADGYLKKPLVAAIKVERGFLCCLSVVSSPLLLNAIEHVVKRLSPSGTAARGACGNLGDVLAATCTACSSSGTVFGHVGCQTLCGTTPSPRPPPGVVHGSLFTLTPTWCVYNFSAVETCPAAAVGWA